ncbi:MAG: T9SS type A sorting domain-containing protein [Bacteroidia bacterium]|nr:T9SS type A sorting domain-containing protein [Bacteroidia bacterium]
MKKKSFLFFLFLQIVAFSSDGLAQISTSNGNGDWNNPATWSPAGVPAINNDVIIRPQDSVWVSNPTQVVNDLTINGILSVSNVASAHLSFDGDLSVNGKLYNNGKIEMVTYGKAFNMGPNSHYFHNPLNNLNVDVFSQGIENFNPTSTLVMMNWDDESIPLGSSSRVTSDFGNVVLCYNSATTWEQRGRFGPPGNANRVKGSFTVSAGIISMDDGSSSPTSSLTLQTVLITGTANVIFQKGPNRNLTLITGNFTDNSSSTLATILKENCYATLDWTVNGNLNLSHQFIGILGTLNESTVGRLTVNGNFTISGGSFEYCSKVNGLTEITVTGNTSISGTTSKVRFSDGNNQNMNFTTNNFLVSACNEIVLFGGNPAVSPPGGTPTVIVNNDFLLSGPCSVTILDSCGSTRKTLLDVGRDLISSDPAANLQLADNRGPVTLRVGRHLSYNGGSFIGQASNNSTAVDSVIVAGNYTFNSSTNSNYFRLNYGKGASYFHVNGNMSVLNSGTADGEGVCLVYIPLLTDVDLGTGMCNVNIGGTYTQSGGRFTGIYRGAGILNFNCTAGLFDMNGGHFYGIYNIDTIASGEATFNLKGIDYDGGFFVAHNGNTASGKTLTINVTDNCKINFTSVSDQFCFIGRLYVQTAINALMLNVNIGGNLTFSGLNGSFISTHSSGTETIVVNGNMTVSGGINYFNVFPNSGYQTNGHLVNMTVFGNVTVTGGLITLSAELGTLIGEFKQNLTISNGDFILKSGYGGGTLSINGGFSQTGGTTQLYKNIIYSNNMVIQMIVNADNDNSGDFSHTGGTISFSDNNAPNSTENVISIKSPNFSIGGSGVITSAGAGNSLLLGIIEFSRTGGTTNFSRTGNTHNITQTRYLITTDVTVEVVTGNMQLASHTNSAVVDMLKINANGVLWLHSANQIFSNGTYPFCNILTLNFSRIKIENIYGLYNGATTAAFNASNNLNFSLATGNFIEYCGTANQIVTGLGVGIATLQQHKYGALEINHQGIPGTNYVYPAADLSVFVKYKLVLTQGEFNLDPDNNPATLNGRKITIETASPLGITRTNGYIKSETRNGSAAVRWFMGTVNSGAVRIIPFGVDPSNYIPVKITIPSGAADTVTIATYHTPLPDNVPFPPTVSHLNDLSGIDNSVETVDRFWYINFKMTPASVNYEFNYLASEAAMLSGLPNAQKWRFPGATAWTFPYPGVQSNIANGVVANGISDMSGWWALSAITSPLPVALLSFEVACENDMPVLKWVTASERDNDYFTVLKSDNGKDFKILGKVEGQGTTSVSHSYYFIDKTKSNRLTYYKLAQTDFDGKSSDFEVIGFNGCQQNFQMDVRVVERNLLITVPADGDYQLLITDISGREILNDQLRGLNKGVNHREMNLSDFSNGIYLVRIANWEKSVVTKFFISR